LGTYPICKRQDSDKITGEIAALNNINLTLSRQHKVNYIDITSGSPENRLNLTYLAEDGLHPSSKAYKRWAEMLAKCMNGVI
jgi:lysophospholipase L1-like esterase